MQPMAASRRRARTSSPAVSRPLNFSIFQIADFTSQAGTITSTITLPTAVPGAQFRLFDIDYAAGQFADRVTVTGSFNGSPVTPNLTNGVSNYVVGNSAYGDATSADASANGNVVVTFAAPVDTIIVTYGSHSLPRPIRDSRAWRSTTSPSAARPPT